MNLDWLLGLIEGEGCFTCSSGKYIQPKFIIGLHNKDREALLQIRDLLNLGHVSDSKKNSMSYFQIQKKSECQQFVKLLKKIEFILPSKSIQFEKWVKIVRDNPYKTSRYNNDIQIRIREVLGKHPEGIWINELSRESKVNISSLYYNLRKKMAQEVEIVEIKKATTKKGKPVMVYYRLINNG